MHTCHMSCMLVRLFRHFTRYICNQFCVLSSFVITVVKKAAYCVCLVGDGPERTHARALTSLLPCDSLFHCSRVHWYRLFNIEILARLQTVKFFSIAVFLMLAIFYSFISKISTDDSISFYVNLNLKWSDKMSDVYEVSSCRQWTVELHPELTSNRLS